MHLPSSSSLPPLPSSLSSRLLSTINPQTGACKHHPAVQLCELVEHNTRWVVKRKICSKCGARAPVGVSRRMPGVSVVNPSSSRRQQQQQPESSRGRSSGEVVMQHLVAASSSSRHDASMSKSRTSGTAADLKEMSRAAKEANGLAKSSSSKSKSAVFATRERGHNIDLSDRTGYVDKKHSSRSKSTTRRTRSLSQPRRKERILVDDGDANEEEAGEQLPGRRHGRRQQQQHGRRSSSRNSKEGRSRVTWSTKPESLSSSERSSSDNRNVVDQGAAASQQQLVVIPKKKRNQSSKEEKKYHQTFHNTTENNIVSSVYSKPLIHIDGMDRVVHQSLSQQVCM